MGQRAASLARREQGDHRTYGRRPYSVVVIHGGPGAAGEMEPVARELSRRFGVVEPFQTAASLDGQIDELRAIVASRTSPPVTLVGYSWGAWLGYLVAARHRALIRKLVLVSSPPFAQEYVSRIEDTRLARLDEPERHEWHRALESISNPDGANRDAALEELGTLASKADTYDPVAYAPRPVSTGAGDRFSPVWSAAEALRRGGELVRLGPAVRCPVVAIHGDYDPHPAEGVEEPLSAVLDDFQFILLSRCGHTPWLERQARDAFFQILAAELRR